MRTDVFIGIDLGSTGLKAVAFEAGSGLALASAGGPLPYARLPDGGCELDAKAIGDALVGALQQVASALGPRVMHVRAIGCTGHGAGLYALDERLQLLRGIAVGSTDQRAAARARALSHRHGADLFGEVGCRPWPGQPTLIAAELLSSGALQRRELRRVLFAKDYLALLLCGEIASDASDASTAGLLSLATGQWSKAAFETAGLDELPPDLLPPLVQSGTAIGGLLPSQAAACGLPPGLPVATSAIDLLASMTAVGATRRGQAVLVLGTWCVNAAVGPVLEPKPAVEAIVNFGDPARRLYMENSPSSMANLAWLARTLQFPSVEAVIDCALSAPLGAEGLRFLPFINGGGTPPGATAGFVGLRHHHDRPHMARAVVDAVAALHARHIARLAACGLGVPGSASVLGGGARDLRLVQLLASFLGHAVERCGDDETGARGAALYAAASQGHTGGPHGSVLPAPCSVVEPLPGSAHADFRAGFDALIDSLSPAYAHLAELSQ